MRRPRGPLVISSVYFTFGFLWILISDEALKLFAASPESYQRLQTAKGWIYVVITTVLIYLLLHAYANMKERALQELNRQKEVLHDVLEEKNELIRELDHRVKNNLQLVISLIGISRSGSASKIEAYPDTLAGRIHAISAIQEAMFAGGIYARVSLERYLTDLLAYLKSDSMIARAGSISLMVEEGITMSAERAVPFGIVFHELAGNALSHAYKEGDAGAVEISVSLDSGSIVLKVEDFGKGFDAESVSGEVGLVIAEAMSSQIEGRLTIASSASGTAAVLTVPV